MARICPQCGSSNDDSKAFCAQCGAPIGAAPGAPGMSGGNAPANANRAKTVLGMSSADMMPPAPAPVRAPVPAPAPTAPAAASPNRTVLGMPAIGTPAPPPASPAPASPPPNHGAAPTAPGSAQKTMLGVAIPGIAPLQPGPTAPASQGPAPPSSTAPASAARLDVQNENRTMLGVPAAGTIPQKAPANPHAGAPLSTAMFGALPAPPPLELEPLPAPPKKVVRRGAPMGLVLGGLAALVLGIGATVVVLHKGASPLIVQPRLSPKGTDVLHVACDSCADGTKVSLGEQSADFKNKEADLELAAPLKVGENPLVLKLARPGGREESVKADVPVRYRIRTDLSSVSDATPSLKVVVETEPGATVKLDGKPLALDGTGHAVLPIDISSECVGMADESRTIERNVAYEVTLKDHTEQGKVTARVGVPALRVDAPLAHTVLASDRFFVAGRTVKGASVTVNGRPVTVDPAGIFAEPFGAPTPTEVPIEVRASVPSSAPRTASLKVRRSDALESQARAADKAAGPIKYTELVAASSGPPGKSVSIEGDVSSLRVTNHQSVVVVQDTRNCDKAPCVVRVVHGAELDLKPGTKVLVVGRISRAFTAPGAAAVPEVEAEFVAPLGGKR